KMGMVAEMMAPIEAVVPWMPNAWATWPTPIPKMPRAAARGSALKASVGLPIVHRKSVSTAMANRIAGSVNGGTDWSPHLGPGIEKPHITASSNIQAVPRTERPLDGTDAGRSSLKPWRVMHGLLAQAALSRISFF